MACDACAAARFAPIASLRRPSRACNLPFGRPENKNGSPNPLGEPLETQLNVSDLVRALRLTTRIAATQAATRNTDTSTDTNAKKIREVLRPLDRGGRPAPLEGVQDCQSGQGAPAQNAHRTPNKKSPAQASVAEIALLWASGKKHPPHKEVAKDVIAAFGHLAPHQVNPLMVGALVAEWRKKFSANYTYNRRQSLQEFLGYLTHFGAQPMKPPRVPYPANRAIVMRGDELARLLTNPPAYVRLYILLYLQCGLRRAEALAVTPRTWDRENHTVSVKVKGGHTRTLEVTADVENMFAAAGNDPDPDTSFIHILRGRRISDSALRQAWRRHRRACGIPDTVTAHDLRRSAATILYAATKDLRVPQQLLGHKSLASTLKYLAPLAPDEARRYSELLRFDQFHPKEGEKPQ